MPLHAGFSHVGILICVCWIVGCVDPASAQTSRAQKAQVDQLRAIGAIVAKAVVERDIETLLKYDRPDLREVDRLELRRKNDLYCYLLDSTCTLPNRLAVRDILAKSKDLGIEIKLLDAPSLPPHGLLLFFDRAAVDVRKLGSASYLCELDRSNQIASWSFKFEKDTWVSVTPLFNLETDTLCSPDSERQ
jgi:hypothetical protein